MTEHDTQTNFAAHQHEIPPPVVTRSWPIIVTFAIVAGAAFVARAEIEELRAQTAELSSWRAAHDREHTTLVAHVEALASQQEKTDLFVRDVSDRLHRIDTNVALVCQTTRGANCQRP